MLIRLFGENEASSAEWAFAQMSKVNDEAGREIFTKEDTEIVALAIIATIPLFEGEAVIQPHLYKDSHIVVAALALADLGEAGMGMPSTFINGSCALFREENLDIGRDMRSDKPIPDEKKEQYRQRILKYLEWQKTFLEERKVTFDEHDIFIIPKEKRDAVRGLFSNFDESAKMIDAIREALEDMAFEDAAAYMGYGRPEEVKAARDKVDAIIVNPRG